MRRVVQSGFFAAIALGLTAFSSPGHAGVTFYTDPVAFTAASATVRVEDFERFSPANTPLPSFSRNGNIYQPDSGGSDVFVALAANPAFGVPSGARSTVLTGNGLEDFRVSFGTQQRAVGFDTYLNNMPARVQVFGAGGKLLAQRSHNHASTETGFLGMVSTEPITAVRWTADPASNTSVNTGIDNIRAAGTARVSVADGGLQSVGGLSHRPDISDNGRFVVFESAASNLVSGDGNAAADIFVHDRATGTTARVSVTSAGIEANNGNFGPVLSGDGRFAAFSSSASNLIAGETNSGGNIYVHDRNTGATTRVSGGTSGGSAGPALSNDGRFVGFQSFGFDLVPNDTNSVADVFLYDRIIAKTARVSVSSGGAEGSDHSLAPALSGDGRFVAFASRASNLVPGDTNGRADVFVRDRLTSTTTRVSVATGGAQTTTGGGFSSSGPLSEDGRFVAFHSTANNLVPGDSNTFRDVFLHDRVLGATTRVSLTNAGAEATGGESRDSALSANGRTVAFSSLANNLVPGDTNGLSDIFLRDRLAGTTTRVNVSGGGAQATGGDSFNPTFNGNGKFAAFESSATNMVADDTNGFSDIFIRVLDQDGDRILDENDNCLVLANSSQSNNDGDVEGDSCDFDDDNDGMPDSFETANGLDPFDPADAAADADGDGFTNLEEFEDGTDPLDPKSNRGTRAGALSGLLQLLLD